MTAEKRYQQFINNTVITYMQLIKTCLDHGEFNLDTTLRDKLDHLYDLAYSINQINYPDNIKFKKVKITIDILPIE